MLSFVAALTASGEGGHGRAAGFGRIVVASTFGKSSELGAGKAFAPIRRSTILPLMRAGLPTRRKDTVAGAKAA